MIDERDRAARAFIEERDERERQERARATGPDGRYLALPPSDEALRDLIEQANNYGGAWVRATPSGYWFDAVETARELAALRAEVERLRAREARIDALRAAVARLREVGGQLSNVAYNLGQPARAWDESMRLGLADLARQWDSAAGTARRALSALEDAVRDGQ